MNTLQALTDHAATRPELDYFIQRGKLRARLMVRVNRLQARRILPCIKNSGIDIERIQRNLNSMNIAELDYELRRISQVYHQAMREPHPLNPADADTRERRP